MPALNRDSMYGQQLIKCVIAPVRLQPAGQHHGIEHPVGELNLGGLPQGGIQKGFIMIASMRHQYLLSHK
ncbi:hypothetical protein D3C87_1723000 [compost metagenome]